MADGGNFVILELATSGLSGERFEWTSDERAPTGQRGGARACPLKPWTLSGALRKVRTDYAGALSPSFQVLGPVQKPFTLGGKWDDRYNFPGYAEQEKKRFEDMCRRGNLCRFSYGSQVVEGLIDTWDFPYRRAWDIGYSFSVDVMDRSEDRDLTNRSPPTVLSPAQSFDDTDLAVQSALDAHDEVPASALGGSLAFDTEGALVDVADARLALSQTLDNQDLNPGEHPVDAFARLATQFRTVQSAAATVVAGLIDQRSDTALMRQTPMAVLGFEVWSRSLRFTCRAAMASARKGDQSASERATPSAQRIYRPQEGESLYAISQQFYGTPWAWKLIADRNHLTTFVLDGTEFLIIPERGTG